VIIFLLKFTDVIYMKKKNPIVSRIDTRAAELGTSRPELAAKAKIAKNTFANWNARDTMPPADIALAIADALQCSVRWLVTGANDKQEEYTVEEKTLIFKFRVLNKQGQYEVKTLLDAKTVPMEKKSTG
jgi:transcriptional regulator with XRE-family HTH domain